MEMRVDLALHLPIFSTTPIFMYIFRCLSIIVETMDEFLGDLHSHKNYILFEFPSYMNLNQVG